MVPSFFPGCVCVCDVMLPYGVFRREGGWEIGRFTAAALAKWDFNGKMTALPLLECPNGHGHGRPPATISTCRRESYIMHIHMIDGLH